MTEKNFSRYSKYYDLLYKDKDYEFETGYVIKLIEENAPDATSVIELGCGTGNHAKYLCESNYRVVGIEKSEEMVREAVSKNIRNFEPVVGDASSCRVSETFDVALSLFHVISYITDNSALINCFNTTNEHLKIGGIFIFDVWYSPAVLTQRPDVRVKRLEDSNVRVLRVAEPQTRYNENIIDVNYQVIIEEKSTGKFENIHETHSMRHFSIPEIDLLCTLTGFKIISVQEFGNGQPVGHNTWGACFVVKKKQI